MISHSRICLPISKTKSKTTILVETYTTKVYNFFVYFRATIDSLAPFLFVIVVDYILRQSMAPANGLAVRPPKSRRDTGLTLTDLDFALLSDTIDKAQQLLTDLEAAADKVGLHLNASKTEYMTFNIDDNEAAITSSSGTQLKQVNDFKYLGSYIADSKKDFLTRKALAWTACQKLHKVWSSGISPLLKVKFFRACVEPILLYGSETWTMQKAFEKRLDGCYTRLLMRI